MQTAKYLLDIFHASPAFTRCSFEINGQTSEERELLTNIFKLNQTKDPEITFGGDFVLVQWHRQRLETSAMQMQNFPIMTCGLCAIM